jgi:hypothetical protein
VYKRKALQWKSPSCPARRRFSELTAAFFCGGPVEEEALKSTSSESGHLLLALMIGLTVMAIFLTVVAQQWSQIERRENEKELLFRGNQYIKAIKKFQMQPEAQILPLESPWSQLPG